MASLHKQPNRPFWFAAYTTADGKRHFKSTGTKNKKVASDISRTWQAAALHGDSLTKDKAREIIERGVETALLAAGQSLPGETIRAWCKRWLESKEVEKEATTHSRYELGIRRFVEHLGTKADRKLDTLTSEIILSFRDHCAKSLSVGSTNLNLKIVRAALNSARRQGLMTGNPASAVAALAERGESKRRDMTMTEIQAVLKECGQTEWRGLVLLGLYSGQRLRDCSEMTWGQVDLMKKTVSFVTQKTGKRLQMRMAEPLANYLESLPASDNPAAPVFPRFSGFANLSNAFALEVLIPAGLMAPRANKHFSSGKGRTGKRLINEVTFHSLRHSFTTMLKATGASNALAEMIVGHDSPAVSRKYTHLSSDDTTEAIGKLPDVTAKGE